MALQLMDALEGALGLSQRTQQSVVALLAMGPVITTVLAWSHGQKGQQRVSLAELIAVGVTVTVGLSATALLWVGADGPTELKGPAESVTGSVPDVSTESDSSAVTGPEEGEDLETVERAFVPDRTAAPERSTRAVRTPPLNMRPENPIMVVGDTVRLDLDTDEPVLWASSDHSVALVMSDGLVLGVGTGTTEIVASVAGTDVSTRVTIQAAAVSEIDVAAVGTMGVGASTRASVVVRLANGETRANAEPEWTSTNPAVVRVSQDGTLTAVAPGSARVSAEVDGVSGSIDVIVEDRPEAETLDPPVSPDIVFAVLERYRAALEDRSIADVLAVYPGLSPEERAGWVTLFGLGDITVEFSSLTVREADSDAAQVQFEQILTGDRIERNATRFVATLVRDDGAWQIQQLRSVAPGL